MLDFSEIYTVHRFLILVSLTLLPVFPSAQSERTAFLGATIYPVGGLPIDEGMLVVENGRFREVGSVRANFIGGHQVDVSGKVIMPGLVDTHSHTGAGDGGDSSGPLHPDVRILDALDPRADSFERARAGGITTLNVMPGSGHLMSGQTAYLKLRDAATIEEMLFCDDPLTDVCGGMKMANGTNSLRGTDGFPDTRARSAAPRSSSAAWVSSTTSSGMSAAPFGGARSTTAAAAPRASARKSCPSNRGPLMATNRSPGLMVRVSMETPVASQVAPPRPPVASAAFADVHRLSRSLSPPIIVRAPRWRR